MSELQKLGRELNYLHEDVEQLLPNYVQAVMYPLHKIFVNIINLPATAPPEEERKLIQEVYEEIHDITQEWRGILSEKLH